MAQTRIDGSQIKPGSIDGLEIKDGSIKGEDIATGAITADHISPDLTISADKLTEGVDVKLYTAAEKAKLEAVSQTSMDQTSADNRYLKKIGDTINGDLVVSSGVIKPSTPNTSSLGTPDNPFAHVYVGPNSLYVDGNQVITATNTTLNVTTDIDQHLAVTTSGLGTTRIASGKEVILYSSGIINLQSVGDITTLSKGRLTFKTDTDGQDILFETDGTLSNITFKSKNGINFDALNGVSFTRVPTVSGKALLTVDDKFTLSVATASSLGGIKSGGDITIDSSGVVSVNDDSHNHTISTVNGLQTALDGKSNVGHTHDFASVTNKPTTLSGYGITDGVNSSEVVVAPVANKILKLDASGNLPTNITGNANTANSATTAAKLSTARNINLTGDVSGFASFDGTADSNISVTLGNVGTASTYTKVTTDSKGRVVSGDTLSASDIPSLTLSKISDAGTVAAKNVGTSAGNIPVLDSNGKLDSSILPAIAITDTNVVTSQAAMLALTAQVGDVAVRTDLNKSFILKGSDPSVVGNWQELLTPTDAVLSVNGKTGTVNVTASDVGLGNVTNESKSTMFTSPAFTGTPTAPTAATNNNSTQVATTAFVKSQGYLTGNETINVSGDATGSGTNAITLTLKDSGVAAGSYPKVTVDTKGRVTGGSSLSASDIPNLDWSKITTSKPTTLSGYGITDALLNSNGVPSISAGLDASKPTAGTAGRIYIASDTKKIYRDNGSSWDQVGGQSSITWSSITSTPTTLSGYGITDGVNSSDIVTTATANKILKLDASGKLPADITGNAATATTATTAATATTASAVAWSGVTSKPTTLTGYGITDAATSSHTHGVTLGGDLSGSATLGSTGVTLNATLANSGVTAGTYTKVTVDAKGRVTGNSSLVAGDIPTLTLSKISDAGTAAAKNTGIAAGNVPVLDSNGKLDTTILPALAITDTFVVASQTAMLALTAQTGDVAVRTDLNKSFILKGTDATLIASWQELLTPTDAVSSVNGKTGTVTIGASDVGLGNVTNESKATMFASPTFTGTPAAPTPVSTDSSTQIATTAFVKAQGYLTGNQSVSITGDAAGSGTTAITLTLANSGVTAGTYKSVTVDAKGRVTGGTNPTTLSGYGITDAVNSSDVVTTATANKILKLDTNAKLPASITGNADGNAATASKLLTARTITLTGDAVATATSFDGSANISISTSISNLSADKLISGTTNKVFTATEKTKLAGIQASAQLKITAGQSFVTWTHNFGSTNYAVNVISDHPAVMIYFSSLSANSIVFNKGQILGSTIGDFAAGNTGDINLLVTLVPIG